MTKQAKRIQLLNDALSEDGITPFHAMDQPLVTELCEIIGSLHRLATALQTGSTKESDEKIEKWVGASAA